MKALATVLLVLGLIVLVGAVVGAPPASGEEEIQGVTWLTDLDAARAEARTTGRPILIVFR